MVIDYASICICTLTDGVSVLIFDGDGRRNRRGVDEGRSQRRIDAGSRVQMELAHLAADHEVFAAHRRRSAHHRRRRGTGSGQSDVDRMHRRAGGRRRMRRRRGGRRRVIRHDANVVGSEERVGGVAGQSLVLSLVFALQHVTFLHRLRKLNTIFL